MPETRHKIKYDRQGNIIEQTPYEVSDEQLYFEQQEQDNNEAHIPMLQAFRNFDSLTAAQVRQLVKALLRDYLVREKDFYLRVL